MIGTRESSVKQTIRLYGPVLVAFLALASACAKDTPSPAAPTPPPAPPPPPAAALAAPTPMSPIATVQLDVQRPRLEVRNAAATGTVGTVTYRFEWSELDSFPENTRTGSAADVAQGPGDTTTFEIPATLRANFVLFWRARATNGTITSEWSRTESFKTQNKGFQVGQTVYDPLTDGTTVGSRRGGRFVPGEGWHADSIDAGIDYIIPTCGSCRVEFDVTNFGKAEGYSVQKDLKWITMGDGGTFGNFNAFRDHGWKMHLEQRSDGGGTGMKLIWRNGAAGGGEPGDHELRADPAVDWRSSEVYHFVLEWAPQGFTVTINGHVWFEGGFGRNAYMPPNHHISLGCHPRGETIGAIFRNVSITSR